MHSSTSTFKPRARWQIACFLLLTGSLLVTFAVWNQQNWSLRQKQRFDAGAFPGKLAILFENGNISPSISMALYRMGISVRPNYVVVGKGGWMFLGDNFEGAVSRATVGLKSVDDMTLARWTGQLRERQDWLTEQGVRSLFAIVPNKHSVYPEHAPDWLSFDDHGDNERLVAAAESAGVHIVDTTPGIRQQKCCIDWLYNHTDTHWTFPGAFTGYSEVMAGLNRIGMAVEALTPAELEFSPENYPAGGLAKLLGFAGALQKPFDPGYTVDIARPADAMCLTNIDRDFIPSGDCVVGPDRPVVGNYWTARQVDNPAALNDLSVLVVEDSFGYAPSRFYNHSFSTVWHAHLGFILNGERLRKFVEKFKPDLVIYMAVERNVMRPLTYEFDGASGIVEAPKE